MLSSVATLLRWPVESQQTSRRNALLASTALAQVRAERDEIDCFLEAHARRRTAAAAHRAAPERAAEG
jgi:hypothetical protein